MDYYLNLPSLVDSLIDDAPDQPWDGFEPPSLARLEQCLRRDLEELLNSQALFPRFQGRHAGLARTTVAFGLSDLYRVNPSSRQHRERLRREIEEKIATFEPRLHDVRALEVQMAPGNELRLEFRVEGTLRFMREEVPISLSARLNAADNRVVIHRFAAGDGR